MQYQCIRTSLQTQQWGHHQPHHTLPFIMESTKKLLSTKHNKHVIFYKRFIDDVFGIWIPHPNPQTDAHLWEEFKESMNAFPGLT